MTSRNIKMPQCQRKARRETLKERTQRMSIKKPRWESGDYENSSMDQRLNSGQLV